MSQNVPMDQAELDDELEELEFSCTGQARLDVFRARADSLARGEFGRAEFLTYLAQFYEMEDRFDEADAVYDEAMEDGGPTSPHPLAGKLSVAVQRGDEVSADQLVSSLWTLARAKVLTDLDHEWVGEQLEELDRLREAMRWFTVPLSDFDPDDDIDLLPRGCSSGRYRVRRALGLPHDRYDATEERLREEAKARFAEEDLLR